MNPKILFYVLLIPLMLSACKAEKNPNTFSISGEIKHLGTDTIYLYSTDRMFGRMDTICVKGDKFSATFEIDTLVHARLSYGNGYEYPVYLNKGDNLHVKGTIDSISVTGSPLNDELTTLLGELQKMPRSSRKDSVEKFIKEHAALPISLYLLDTYFIKQPEPDLEKIHSLIETLSGELRDQATNLGAFQSLYDNEKRSDKGSNAPFFQLPNAEGERISRQHFKDKYLLLQFWASWDSTSRQENARLRSLYRKQKRSKKFDIMGISLDLDRAAWLSAVRSDSLEWEQVCDFTGWDNRAIELYAITTLPANVLLNPKGRIEAKNLSVSQLEEKLKELLKHK